ncbi:MAG: tripartite tricarboxylate transporter substrate-binding protein [Pigmentiphaga sp.]
MTFPISRRTFLTQVGAASTLLVTAQPLRAQTAQPLPLTRIVLGVPAGSMVDTISRRVADVLKPDYATNVYVENKTGAGGILAVRHLISQPADGRNVYVGVSSPLTVYPETYKNLAYDPERDLIPVGSLGTFDLALAVGPAVPASVTNLNAFFDWCKQNPDKATFGSPGEGSMLHFIGSMTGRSAGVDMRHIPYRGPGPAVIDLVGGMVSAVVVPLSDLTELAGQGKLRILGTTGDVRSRFVPTIPTFAEQGFGEYAMGVWIAVFVAAGTPAPLIEQLTKTLKSALDDAAVRDSMGTQLQAVQWGEADELKQRIRRERASWKKAVTALNFSVES